MHKKSDKIETKSATNKLSNAMMAHYREDSLPAASLSSDDSPLPEVFAVIVVVTFPLRKQFLCTVICARS